MLYRLCYFYDHTLESNGIIRYTPSRDILDCIDNLENYVLQDGFRERFEATEVELLEFLHFVDLLGWNEDVKYHTTSTGEPNFSNASKSNVGRINTILTVISAPLMISRFIIDVITQTENKGVINVRLITRTIQKFTQKRGICILTKNELLSELSPFLTENSNE